MQAAGDTFIPASQRPDGTWRKARRVKEGYVPQEEVPLYESKGKQFVSQSSKPQRITLPSGEVAQQTIPGLYIIADKGKTKKKQTKNVDEIVKQVDKIKIVDAPIKAKVKVAKAPTEKPTKPTEQSNNHDVDPVKRLRNLKKRLREAEQLEENLKNGLLTKPEPDQLAKVQRKNDILMQIYELEKKV
ncbi:hypothetical protein PPYR_13494 [Photinus pyralis]|uniref:Partner of Y14 and mago n=1 Tax=Photinus pyralis TaxID=7054 RepID=A0A5N4A981_PHOPY|nr:partner of Y14 and mago [Photinus pyralis]KAB0793874.1 hypothetical protein PPYR_13494 [Photinus pyralis]